MVGVGGGGDQRRPRSSSSESSVMTLVRKEDGEGVKGGGVELQQSRGCVIAQQMEMSGEGLQCSGVTAAGDDGVDGGSRAPVRC